MASDIRKPSYGGGSISHGQQGGSISPAGSTIKDSTLLIDNFSNFIVTEASEKIVIDTTITRGFLGATIGGQPAQGGTIKPAQ